MAQYKCPKRDEVIDSTPHLFVFNLAPRNKGEEERIVQIFSQYGAIVNTYYPPNMKYGFVSFSSTEEAQRARDALNRKLFPELALLPEVPVKIDYSLVKSNNASSGSKPTYMKDFSIRDTLDVRVPGLILIKDFVTEEEEAELIQEADNRIWKELKMRKIQQYGFEFAYSCRNVDPAAPIDPFPFPFSKIAAKIVKEAGVKELDQLTINDYPIRSGIGSHIDTHSAFEDEIISLSLGSSSVMVFLLRDPKSESREIKSAKALLLPPRSLLVMRGEARYIWEHGIPFRISDVDENGIEIQRGRRVSFTYRKVRGRTCFCDFPEYCDRFSNPTNFQE